MKTTIACCQMQSGLGTKDENIAKMIARLEEVTEKNDVDLVVFPELATTGYEVQDLYPQLAEEFPAGPTVEVFKEQAKKHNVHIAYGFVEKATKDGQETIYNSVALIDNNGNVLGAYRKSHLVDGAETPYFTKGTEYPVFDTSIGKIGLLVCWDLAYPEPARILALKGAEIIVAPAAWETEENVGDWEIVNMARSFDNVVYVASCNHVGKDRTLEFFGRSKVSGPLGRPISEAADGEETVIGTVDLDVLPELREGYYVLLKDRNPNTYEELIKA